MRMFRAAARPGRRRARSYCCQDDGMVGLGCGARSYTRGAALLARLRRRRRRACGRSSPTTLARPAEAFAVADYGFRLDADEQRRRYVLQSLLHADGLDAAPRTRAGSAPTPLDDLPELAELEPTRAGGTHDGGRLAPDRARAWSARTRSGPGSTRRAVRALMAEYEWR